MGQWHFDDIKQYLMKKQLKIIFIITLLSIPLLASIETRIVDGSKVSSSSERWSWIVSLRTNDTHTCGATLISPLWVLTAGHCVVNSQNRVTPIDKLRIANGSYELYNYKMKKYSVEKIIVHPNYNATTHDNDIALIKLKDKVSLDNFPQIKKGVELNSGRVSWIAGWGIEFLTSDMLSRYLQEAKVPIVNFNICNSHFAYDGDLTENMLCAGYITGGADACIGDSGGPLLTYDGSEQILIGVTSWGRGCGEFSHPGIYMNIENYYDWIKSYNPNLSTSTYSKNITKLYVATFNRAPDANGIEYWLNSELNLEDIAQSFFDQEETQTLYPSSTQESLFVESVYRNLFNREPDSEGWIYWIDAISSGTISRSLFILAVINGAKGDDITILSNKQKVGEYFANSGLNYTEDAKMVISNITSTDQSVEEAIEMIDGMVLELL